MNDENKTKLKELKTKINRCKKQAKKEYVEYCKNQWEKKKGQDDEKQEMDDYHKHDIPQEEYFKDDFGGSDLSNQQVEYYGIDQIQQDIIAEEEMETELNEKIEFDNAKVEDIGNETLENNNLIQDILNNNQCQGSGNAMLGNNNIIQDIPGVNENITMLKENQTKLQNQYNIIANNCLFLKKEMERLKRVYEEKFVTLEKKIETYENKAKTQSLTQLVPICIRFFTSSSKEELDKYFTESNKTDIMKVMKSLKHNLWENNDKSKFCMNKFFKCLIQDFEKEQSDKVFECLEILSAWGFPLDLTEVNENWKKENILKLK